jgi:hypothetical protein
MMHQFATRFHSVGGRLVRIAGLLALAALGPACYSSSGHNYMAPAAPAGPGVLFSDAFVTFPGTNWTAPSMATVSVTNPYTPPFYFLTMTDTARPGSTSTTTTMSFTTQDLSFSVDVFYSAASASQDTLSVVIVDGSNAVLAQATLDASTGMMTFKVGADTVAPAVALSAAGFHTVIFSVDTMTNMAVWKVGATTTASHAFGPATTKLQLAVSYATTANPAPTFKFGNVSISDP